LGHPLCGNRKCVNPEHVIAVTRRDLSLKYAKDNPFRRNALATQCIRGHAFSPDNIWHYTVDKGIARACLKCWALRHPGKTTKKPNRRCDAIAPRHARLIKKAVPLLAELPKAIRDDATSILHIEILSGSVAKDELERAVQAAKRQAWKMQPDKWRSRSLDEPLASGGTLLDRIADDYAFADTEVEVE
jgi:hypothetical protein